MDIQFNSPLVYVILGLFLLALLLGIFKKIMDCRNTTLPPDIPRERVDGIDMPQYTALDEPLSAHIKTDTRARYWEKGFNSPMLLLVRN